MSPKKQTSPEERAKQREYYRNWYRNNPERAKEISDSSFRTYYTTRHGRATHMLNSARQRARRFNIEFSLTHEWLFERLKKGVCEVTGLPFEFQVGGGKGHRTNPFSPSLDRIDNQGGYTPDNVRVVIWIYNRARGAFSDDALTKMVLALAQKLKSEAGSPDQPSPSACGTDSSDHGR